MAHYDPFGFSGTLIDAQIQVGDPVGEGGFSVVYRARHVGLEEDVALKCLKMPAGIGAKMGEGIVERFRAETRISYRLSQGNLDIVRSVSSGAARAPTSGELVPYIALEWLEGPSLAQELKSRRAAGLTGRPLGEVLDVLEPAAIALDYAHKQGVVHRDIKPGNLVLAKARDGGSRIKVLDFGLAKVIDPEGIGLAATAQTVTSVILCSPGYGAPEQFDNALGPVGSYTDVYSFALIVLEMLRDDRIRTSTSVAIAARQALSSKPISPLALGLPVTPAIDALFQRTLARDRSQRPKDMGEFWGDLKKLATAPVSQPHGPGGGRAPGFAAWSEQNVTRPMQRPASAPPPPLDLGSTVPDQGPPPAADRLGNKGTMLMVQRPPTPQPMAPAFGAVTAPMPAFSLGAPLPVPPIPPSGALPITRIGELPTDPATPPVAASQPLAAPPDVAAPTGVAATPPAVVAPAARTSKAPRANPPGRSRLVVALLVTLSFLVFASLVTSAGYFAHSWFASRHANGE